MNLDPKVSKFHAKSDKSPRRDLVSSLSLVTTYDPGTNRVSEYLIQRDATSNAVVSDDHHSYTNSGAVTEDSNVTSDPVAGTDTQCYGYDQLDNLTEAWTPADNDCSIAPSAAMIFGGPAPYWTGYAVDPATGNRTSTTTHTISTDPATAGTVAATDTATYHYPAAGSSPGSTGAGSGGANAVSTITDSGGAPTQTYSYNSDGSSTALPGHTISYNDQGLPGSQTINGTTETDIYDASGNLLVSSDPTNGTSAYLGDTQLHAAAGATAVSASRTYTFAGMPVAERDTQPATTTSILDYLGDTAQGTVTSTIADSDAALTRRYYDPFGSARGATTTWPEATESTDSGNHGFLNAPQDLLTTSGATGGADPTTQLGARQYDADLGRFLTVDPLLEAGQPQAVNGYAYANNDPVNSSDPDGQMPVWDNNQDVPYCDWHNCTPTQQASQTKDSGASGGSVSTNAGNGFTKVSTHVYVASDSEYLAGLMKAYNYYATSDFGGHPDAQHELVAWLYACDNHLRDVSCGQFGGQLELAAGSGHLQAKDVLSAAGGIFFLGSASPSGKLEVESVRVGRWMEADEYKKMTETGEVQFEPASQRSYVVYPADPQGFKLETFRAGSTLSTTFRRAHFSKREIRTGIKC